MDHSPLLPHFLNSLSSASTPKQYEGFRTALLHQQYCRQPTTSNPAPRRGPISAVSQGNDENLALNRFPTQTRGNNSEIRKRQHENENHDQGTRQLHHIVFHQARRRVEQPKEEDDLWRDEEDNHSKEGQTWNLFGPSLLADGPRKFHDVLDGRSFGLLRDHVGSETIDEL